MSLLLVAHSCLILCDPMDLAHKAPLSTEFLRQEYWSGLPLHSPRDLPNPGVEPGSPALQAESLLSELPGESNLNVKMSSKQLNQLPFWKEKNTKICKVVVELMLSNCGVGEDSWESLGQQRDQTSQY